MTELENLEGAMAAIEKQRAILGDMTVDVALSAFQRRLSELQKEDPKEPMAVLAGERKLVTVMFADISGFTALSERLDPENVRRLMNDCFDDLAPVITRFGGTIEKFIGDCIMAVFGAPAAHENDPERALRAALELMTALVTFNTRNSANLNLHIGVNTGLAVAGGIGSRGCQQYGVMGDTVNVAARLEDASETGQIYVGPQTYHLTSSAFEFETLVPIRVKGKSGPVPIYRLIGLKAEPGPSRGIAGLRSPLVGRDAELAHLRAAVRGLASGKGTAIAVTGEPGLGKSRLIAELRQFVQMELPATRWAEAHTQSYADNMTYWIVRGMLDSLVGISADMPSAEVGVVLWGRASALLGAQAETTYSYLARLRQVPLNTELDQRVSDVMPEALQNRMRQAFGDLVRALSQEQPIVMVWEDLHWADPSSLGLLETLLPLPGDVPVLLLLSFRPNEGRVQEWQQRIAGAPGTRPFDTIGLAPLTLDDSTRLVENLLAIEHMPFETRQLILNKAEGNPFFLEELLRSLLEAGYVVRDGNRVVTGAAIEHLDVPDTLQGVIAARIDRLPPDDKRSLQTASVLGRVFQPTVLGHLLDQEHAGVSLDTTLSDLQQKELIRRRRELEFTFKHAVTHEVTYNSILLERRKSLHRMSAEAIEVLFSGQLEDLAATLAYHYERAEVGSKAIHYLARAADRARHAYANTEAIAYYQAALNQVSRLQRDEPQIELWRERAAQFYARMGDILALTGRNDEARVAYRDALACVPDNDRVGQSRLHRLIGNAWKAQRQPAEADAAYDQAGSILESARTTAADPAWLEESLETSLDRMESYYFSNSIAQMQALAGQVESTIQVRGKPIQQARFFYQLGLMSFRLHRYRIPDGVLALVQKGLAASRESDNKSRIMAATFELGVCYLWREQLNAAESELESALALAEHIGDREYSIMIMTWLTATCRRSNQVDKTRQYAARSLESATTSKVPLYIALAKANLAWIAWRDGNLADAQANSRTALDIFARGKAVIFCKWLAIMPLIDIALRQGGDSEAVEFAREMQHPNQMHLSVPLEELLAEAVTAWDAHDAEGAHALLKRGIDMAQQTGWM